MSSFDDYGDEMPEEFEAFAAGVRAAATRMPEPSRALADLLITGVSSPPTKRSFLMKAKTYVAGLGLAAKVMLGAGMAAAATLGAGAAGVLPVTPFEQAHHDETAQPTTTTTTIAPHEDHEHDGDTPKPVVVEPTTTTTTLHHEEPTHENPSTTTTTMRHEEPTTTSTTTVNHDGDNNNPESLSITCKAAHEPNAITCNWTPSSSPEHVRYALLRINNQNTEGRVVTTTETGLEYTDTTVTSGWGYGYRVVSLRADGTTESHSNMFTLMCC